MIEPSRQCRFRILGPMEVWSGADWVSVSAPKWRSLLALLLLRPGQPVSTDELVDGIWGDEPPAKATNLVSGYVLRLRRLMGDDGGSVILTRAPGYQVVVGAGESDADRFAQLADEGRGALTRDPAAARSLLTQALGLWRGRALVDVPAVPRIFAEAERLEESRVSVLEWRAEADLACGEADRLVPELRRALEDNPLREGLWALLMRALQAGGRQAEALEAYAQARELIADELGVDPGAGLRQAHADILRADTASADSGRPRSSGPRSERREPGDAGQGTTGASPEAAAPPRPAQLPADIPDFTGRAEQVAQIRRLLAEGTSDGGPGALPVVVLMGSGGLGKTTLAVHVAHRLAGEYPDGQLHASLLGVTQPADPAEVLARFLRDLGEDPLRMPVSSEERAARFRSRLAGKRVLLVLDDARDAAQVQPLLPGSGSCAVLITSRSRLPELVGTRVLDLDVLPPPEARALFGRVAGEDRTRAEPEATAEVLAACAGLPLAIRIAGARLAARGGWNVHYLADRLSDERRRLDELRTGNLAVRASFEVSFASLARSPGGADPTRSFRLLGLWTGASISLPAAAALLGEPEFDVADALEVLVDAHLLDAPAPDRYRFHDLLRVFAADRARAQESDASRREAITRLLTWYLHTMEAAALVISPQHARVPLPAPPPGVRPLRFASLDSALEWCESERAGLAAATRLAAEAGLHELAWQLPAAAMSFLNRRSHWADWVATHEIGLASARALGDRAGQAWMLNNLGIAFGQQRMERAVPCFEQALALYQELGDLRGESRAATNVAKACFDLRRLEEALDAANRSLIVQRQAGKRYGEGVTLGVLGCAYRELGRFREAIEHFQQALAIFRELGDQQTEADSLSDLGEAYLGLDRVGDAVSCLLDSLALRRMVGDRHGQAVTLRRLALARARGGDAAGGATLLAEALDLFDQLGDHAQAAEIRASLTAVAAEAS